MWFNGKLQRHVGAPMFLDKIVICCYTIIFREIAQSVRIRLQKKNPDQANDNDNGANISESLWVVGYKIGKTNYFFSGK